MTKLLATTAIALIGFSGMASAQSVLERVLGKIDNSTNLAPVNGTFANIAENIGGGTTTNYMSADGNIISASQYDSAVTSAINSITYDEDEDEYVYGGEGYDTMDLATAAAKADVAAGYTAFQVQGGGVNASITNVVQGIEQATQTALAGSGVSAIEWNMPTLSWGDMATTALGAVNTGEITLGVNQAVDSAKTTSTAAYSAVVDQLGGSDKTGVLVLNVASNMTGINGSISNTMSQVNGTVGDLSTTALGAVNTGTITSGVNAAVTGIIGTSGTGQN